MTRKPVRALVKPEILTWARESAGYNLDEVAASSQLSKVPEWEAGKLRPTINQLRTLAKKYKRPLAVFYLQEKPTDFQVISDFRRLPGEDMQRMSPQLHMQIRVAQERREIALDLIEDVGDQAPELSISATLDDNPETVGAGVRDYLQIARTEQQTWQNKRDVFNVWRTRIEEAGVLVFQMDKVDTNEASGFALSNRKLPVIAVNRADVPQRRAFSLLHEFAHLLLSQSGVSEFDINANRPPGIQKVEVWCNAVAAATLLLQEEFLREEIIQNQEPGNPIWAEEDINDLAHVFGVSKISIVRRLLTLGLTHQAFYQDREAEYADAYAALFNQKKAKNASKKFGGHNMHHEALSLLGHSFIRMVFASYHDNKITLRDVSAYLNLKVKHISKVEEVLLQRAAQ